MSPAITSRVGLRFVVVLLMCSAYLLHISAKDETLEETGLEEEEQNFNRMSAEAARQQALLDQKRRQFKDHSSSNMTDFEKRLQAMKAR